MTCANLLASSTLQDLSDRIKSQAAELIRPDLLGRLPTLYWSNSGEVCMCSGGVDSSISLTAFNSEGGSPLFAVWRSDSLALQTYCFNLDIDFGSFDDTFGSVLHFTWQDHQSSALRRLLKRLGPNLSGEMLNFKPKYRNTPFFYATAAGQLDIMKLMLKHGAKKEVIGGPEGTALMVAAAHGRENAVKFLVHMGAATSYLEPATRTTISVFDRAKHFPTIQRWLLVDRWTETKMIEWR